MCVIVLCMCVCLTDMHACILGIGTFNCTFACVSMRAFVCMHEHVCVLDLECTCVACVCVCVQILVTVKLPSNLFVVTTQGKAEEVNAVGKVMVAYVYTTSAREYTMQARIGKVPSILGVRDSSM